MVSRIDACDESKPRRRLRRLVAYAGIGAAAALLLGLMLAWVALLLWCGAEMTIWLFSLIVGL